MKQTYVVATVWIKTGCGDVLIRLHMNSVQACSEAEALGEAVKEVEAELAADEIEGFAMSMHKTGTLHINPTQPCYPNTTR